MNLLSEYSEPLFWLALALFVVLVHRIGLRKFDKWWAEYKQSQFSSEWLYRAREHIACDQRAHIAEAVTHGHFTSLMISRKYDQCRSDIEEIDPEHDAKEVIHRALQATEGPYLKTPPFGEGPLKALRQSRSRLFNKARSRLATFLDDEALNKLKGAE